jgi:hypothetical protein
MSKGKNKPKEWVDWLVDKVFGSNTTPPQGALSPIPVPVRR